jgi:hypothetical protein
LVTVGDERGTLGTGAASASLTAADGCATGWVAAAVAPAVAAGAVGTTGTASEGRFAAGSAFSVVAR